MNERPIIVLHHGLFGFAHKRPAPRLRLDYFHRINRVLGEDGYRVVCTHVAPIGSVAARAQQLADQLDHLNGAPVYLLAHSLGGLDARHMLTRLGRGRNVKALVTIGTPHRGTSFADWVVKRLGRSPIEFTRTKQAEFAAAGLTKQSAEEEILAAMLASPVLMERPVLIRGDRAVIGRPPEDVLDLLND